MATPARAAQRHPKIPKRDVIVVNCHPDSVDGQFHDTIMQAALYDSVNNQRWLAYHGLAGGPRISELRNTLVAQVMANPDFEWMWMIDADMSIGRTTLDDMLARIAVNPEIKVLGALCFGGGRSWKPKPVIYSEPTSGIFEMVDTYPEASLTKVAATGAACLLVHRSVLQAIWQKYKERAHIWFEDHAQGKNQYGEDITFCRRAREVGFDIYVDTAIEIGHMKTFPMFSQLHKVLKGLNPHEAKIFEDAFDRAMGLR